MKTRVEPNTPGVNTDDEMHSDLPDDLYDLSRVRGLYDPLRFVVRLNSEMYRLLEAQEEVLMANQIEPLRLDAFSTFLHETVHWWQHIGSTTGLMLSFASPAKVHINRRHLLSLLATVGPRKSLRTFDGANHGSIPTDSQKHLNAVLNNWHDLVFNSRLITNPQRIHSVLASPYFESVGHALRIGLSDTIWMLAATFDREFSLFPDIRKWDDAFQELGRRRVEGFYFGSPVGLSPVGARHLFEGQARFLQMQYLYLGSGGQRSWSFFRDRGMLNGVYIEAFDFFRSITNTDWPTSPVSPIVQLFLLICDLALNPSDGYPFQLQHFDSFRISNDPGLRFYWFCRAVKNNPALLKSISTCSAEEYNEVSSKLCESMVCATPVEISAELVKWLQSSVALQNLIQQDETLHYSNESLPVRICFAKHLLFAQDRLRRPDYFCWPAMFMADHGFWPVDLNESGELFRRHQPPFMATLSGEIRPTLFEGRSIETTQQIGNEFYNWLVQYDLVDQWIVNDGAFNLDYRSLNPAYTVDSIKPSVDRTFKDAWGVSLDDFILVV